MASELYFKWVNVSNRSGGLFCRTSAIAEVWQNRPNGSQIQLYSAYSATKKRRTWLIFSNEIVHHNFCEHICHLSASANVTPSSRNLSLFVRASSSCRHFLFGANGTQSTSSVSKTSSSISLEFASNVFETSFSTLFPILRFQPKDVMTFSAHNHLISCFSWSYRS